MAMSRSAEIQSATLVNTATTPSITRTRRTIGPRRCDAAAGPSRSAAIYGLQSKLARWEQPERLVPPTAHKRLSRSEFGDRVNQLLAVLRGEPEKLVQYRFLHDRLPGRGLLSRLAVDRHALL